MRKRTLRQEWDAVSLWWMTNMKSSDNSKFGEDEKSNTYAAGSKNWEICFLLSNTVEGSVYPNPAFSF